MDFDTLRRMVVAVEDNNKTNGAQWADWTDASAVGDVYEASFDDDTGNIIDRAIKSNGRSLPVDLRATELLELGQNFGGGGYWIDTVEAKYASGA
jgi:hypothetical protein